MKNGYHKLGVFAAVLLLAVDSCLAAAIVYSSATFREFGKNDGSIANNIGVYVVGDTFTSDVVSGEHVSATNVPSGLTAEFTRCGDNQLVLTLTGSAVSHTDGDDVSNLTVTFSDEAFSSMSAASVKDAVKSNLVVDFAEPHAVENAARFVALPTGGETVVYADGPDDFTWYDSEGVATFTDVAVTGQDFTEAKECEVTGIPSSRHKVHATLYDTPAFSDGEVILISFYARKMTTEAETRFLVEIDGPPYSKYLKKTIHFTDEWKKYYIPYYVGVWRDMYSDDPTQAPPPDGDDTTYGSGELRFRFELGYEGQTIQFADMRVVNYGSGLSGDQYPCSRLDLAADNVVVEPDPDTPISDPVAWVPELTTNAATGAQYLPDFGLAGYHEGEDPLPSGTAGYAIFDVTDPAYGATPDDASDDTDEINAAIAAAEACSGDAIILFPAGRFLVSDFMFIKNTVNPSKKRIMRGAGSGTNGTVFECTVALQSLGYSNWPDLIQEMDDGSSYKPFTWLGGYVWVGNESSSPVVPAGVLATVTGSAVRGDTSVTVDDASGLSAGQSIAFRYYADGDDDNLRAHMYGCVAAELPDGFGNVPPRWGGGPHDVQRMTIASVDGNTVTFKEPFIHDVRPEWDCQFRDVAYHEEIGVEGFRFEFPETVYQGHHNEDGYNAIYVRSARNVWVKDISIVNCDSGVMVDDSKSVTVTGVTISGRGGHYTLKTASSDGVLFKDFNLKALALHNPSFNTYSHTCVYSQGDVSWPYLDQHNGANLQNLFDNLSFNGPMDQLWFHGGSEDVRPTHGAFNTSWNLHFDMPGGVGCHAHDINDGPSSYMVGFTSTAPLMFRYGPHLYKEGMGRRNIAIPSLYEYQLGKHTGTTYPVTFQTDGTSNADLIGVSNQVITHGSWGSQIFAVSPPGHSFTNWVDNIGRTYTDNPLIIKGVTEDLTITANFSFTGTSNTSPVAYGQSVSTDEDTAKPITLAGSDAEGSTLTFSIVTDPANGVVSGSSSNVTYTPGANYYGSDSFTFKVNDGIDDSNIATVQVAIAAVNDAPVANAQSVNTEEDTAKAITLTANDAEGDDLTFSIVTGPVNGVLSGVEPNVTYTPYTGYVGGDSFTFLANDGQTNGNTALVTITVGPADTTPDFICTIRASGGDYTNLSTWETAIESDLTAGSSLLFAISDRDTYADTDDGDTVTFSGGGGGTLKHINGEDIAYIIDVSGTVNAGTVTCHTSGHTFVIADTGTQIGSAVAECYNDWPAGLTDSVEILGWTTTSNRNVWIRTPESERHTGKLKTAGGECTGFTIAASASPVIGIKEQYTEIEGLAIDRISGYLQGISVGEWANRGHHAKVHHCLVNGFGNTYCGITTYASTPIYVYNNIFVESKARFGSYCDEVYCYNNTLYGCRMEANLLDATRARNNLVYYEGGDCYQGVAGGYNAASSHNLSSDGTAPGTSPVTDQTLVDIAFISAVSGSEDLHIAESSSAVDAGVSDPGAGLYSADIDGQTRSGSWDIGADEAGDETPTHEIAVMCGAHGSVLPSGMVQVQDGGSTSFVIQADAHHHIASIQADSAHVGGSPFNDNSYTNDTYLWNNINADGILEVAFSENLWTNNTPETWLWQYYPGTGDYNAAALSDTDDDGLSAWEEHTAGTNPTNALSVFRIEMLPPTGSSMRVRLGSVTGRVYGVDWANSLTGSWNPLTNGIPGTGVPLAVDDDNAATNRFYRGKVRIE